LHTGLTALPDSPTVTVKVVYAKQDIPITLPLSATVEALAKELEPRTGVPVASQKLMFKGQRE